jgi:hypothetical protein
MQSVYDFQSPSKPELSFCLAYILVSRTITKIYVRNQNICNIIIRKRFFKILFCGLICNLKFGLSSFQVGLGYEVTHTILLSRELTI